MKSVGIWSFSGPYFPYFPALRIQSECGNIRTRKTANTDTFSQCHPADLASEKGAFLSATDTNILSSSEDNNDNNNSNNNNDNGDDGNNNINTGDITYSKTFWRTVKPFFTDKTKTKYKITLIEKKIVPQEGQEEIVSEKITTEDQVVAEVFNNFLSILSQT